MSFIITVYTNEGIVMASDSRTTYTTTVNKPDGTIVKQVGVQITDTTYKTFMCNKRIGLSTCGEASINGMPIAGFIESFIAQHVDEDCSVEMTAEKLLSFFSALNPAMGTNFIIAGYNHGDTKQHICRVLIATKSIIPTENTEVSGVLWDGETDILRRLIKTVALKNEDGSYTDIASYTTGYNYFTLQDAIDYAKYAVDVTIKTMNFQNRVKTVGGPIDILVIKPNDAFWVQHKELHA